MLQNVASDQGLHCLQIVQPFFDKSEGVWKFWIDIVPNI